MGRVKGTLRNETKIVSWHCPYRDDKGKCDYVFIPGTGLGSSAPVKGFGNRSWRRNRDYGSRFGGTIKIVPACPKHLVNLVKSVEELKVA